MDWKKATIIKMDLFQTTFLVADYDEAIAWFTGVLGFSLRANEHLDGGKRWVVVGTSGGSDLLLAKAVNESQHAQIGKQAGGRVAFFLRTDNFDRDYERLTTAGVKFLETPRAETYGKVVQFADLYGNKWDLIAPTN